MAKKKRNKPRNMVHLRMVEQHKSVAMKSEKDYDRQRDKQQLKRTTYESTGD